MSSIINPIKSWLTAPGSHGGETITVNEAKMVIKTFSKNGFDKGEIAILKDIVGDRSVRFGVTTVTHKGKTEKVTAYDVLRIGMRDASRFAPSTKITAWDLMTLTVRYERNIARCVCGDTSMNEYSIRSGGGLDVRMSFMRTKGNHGDKSGAKVFQVKRYGVFMSLTQHDYNVLVEHLTREYGSYGLGMMYFLSGRNILDDLTDPSHPAVRLLMGK